MTKHSMEQGRALDRAEGRLEAHDARLEHRKVQAKARRKAGAATRKRRS